MKNKTKEKRKKKEKGKNKSKLVKYQNTATLLTIPDDTFHQPQREKCSYSEFFWSVFSRIRTEYGEILRISSYLIRMRENTEQKISECGHFSRR